MSTNVRCAACGCYEDPANAKLIFQPGSTYPDHWICFVCEAQENEDAEDEFYDEDAAEYMEERRQMGAGWK